MNTLLKMFLKYVVLLVAIAGILAGGVQGKLPPCYNDIECQPLECPTLPCCQPPSNDMEA